MTSDHSWLDELLKQAHAAQSAGDAEEAQKLYKSAIDEAKEREEARALDRSRLAWVKFLVISSRFSEARKETLKFLQEAEDTRTRLHYLMHLAAIAYYTNDYHKVINITNRMLSNPTIVQMPDMKTIAFNQMGIAERHLGLYDKAIDHLQEVLLLVRQHNLPDAGSYDANLAVMYLDRGLYSKALSYFQNSLSKARNTGEDDPVIHALTGLGEANLGLGLYDDAEDYLAQALDMSQNQQKPQFAQVAMVGLANLSLEQARLEAALTYVNQALDESRKSQTRELEVEELVLRGWIQLERGNPGDVAKALKDAETALDINSQLGIEYLEIPTLTLRSAVKLKLGDLNEAAADISRACDLCDAEASINVTMPLRAYHVASQVFDASGDRQHAASMMERARMLVSQLSEGLDPEHRQTFLARSVNEEILS